MLLHSNLTSSVKMGDLFHTLSPLHRVGSIFSAVMFKSKKDKTKKFVPSKKYSLIFGEIVIILRIILYLCLFSFRILDPARDFILTLVYNFETVIAYILLFYSLLLQ